MIPARYGVAVARTSWIADLHALAEGDRQQAAQPLLQRGAGIERGITV
ncbi:MAG: hypothetical protein U1E17_03355 [Geminicoccaceae bacterium]